MYAYKESKRSKEEKKMILVNTDYISGKNLEMLGLVKGSTIQSKNVGKDITYHSVRHYHDNELKPDEKVF
jgi:uncharacterized protein YbjQ (UPF0145 family)